MASPERPNIEARAPAHRVSFARATSLLSALTLLSRFGGLLREQLLAASLGAGPFAEAYKLAFTVPSLLRDLFADGALASAFVPVFAAECRQGGRSAGYRFANRVAGTVLVGTGLCTLAGMIFAPEIVGVLATGFDGEKAAFTATVTRIMMPFLMLVSMAAVYQGMLNAEERFSRPALAVTVFNAVAIVVGLGLVAAGCDERATAIGWSVGVLAGGVGQWWILRRPLADLGFRFRPTPDPALRDPGVKRLALLMIPATIGLAAQNVNVVINRFFASQVAGAIAWLDYAHRLLLLPVGVFGVAIGTIATSKLARRAAEADHDGFRAELRHGLVLVAFLAIPAMVVLVVLSEPLVRVVYQYRRFTAADTTATADALYFYSFGLVAYAAIKVVAPAFYALQRPRVAMMAALIGVATCIAANVLLFPAMGHRGLAVGTAVGAFANLAVLVVCVERMLPGTISRRVLFELARILLAALPALGALLAARAVCLAAVHGDSVPARLAIVAGTAIPGLVAYAIAGRLLDISELREVEQFIRRRLRRRAASQAGREP